MTFTNNFLLDTAVHAVEAAAKAAEEFIYDPGIVLNINKDIKTVADERMNEAIFKILLPTEIPIISEESNIIGVNIPEVCWIIDPLDGTFNFTRGYPFFSVSIALWKDGSPQVGVIKDISNSFLYTSHIGMGAKINEQNMKVSKTETIEKAVLTTGFPSGGNYETNHLMNLVSQIQKFKKIRAIGSASIMLSHVAQGICDVYYEDDIYLWDIAAGILLVEESGGKIFLKRKGNSWKFEVLACNELIYNDAYNLLIK